MKRFDISPFRLPNDPPGEYRFEEPRDIAGLEVTFRNKAPRSLRVHYLRNKWPQERFETYQDTQNPARFGWVPMDDHWNGTWFRAAIASEVSGRIVRVSFKPLSADGIPDVSRVYDVTFRRTLGLKLAAVDLDVVSRLAIFTRSPTARTAVLLRLDAGKRTRAREIRFSPYNARLSSVKPRAEIDAGSATLALSGSGSREIEVILEHMAPGHRYLGDDSHLQVSLDRDSFTICLQDLDRTGPIWYAEAGLYVTRSDRDEPFGDYRQRHAGARTVLQEVTAEPEQSFAGAFYGQPRGHAVNFSLGCPSSPQRYWLEANGDLLLHRTNVDFLGRRPDLAKRFLNTGTARFFFGLERWITCARFDDPSAAPIYSMRFRKGALVVEQEALCVPLARSILEGPLAWEEPTAAIVRFRVRNTGDAPERAEISIGYSQDSTRSQNALARDPLMDDYLVPRSPRDKVRIGEGIVSTVYQGRHVLRAACAAAGMSPGTTASGECALVRVLEPGESCEAVLQIPYVAPEGPEEIAALRGLDFDRSRGELTGYWRAFGRRGSQLRTPVPHLDAVYAAHLTHVATADIAMPGDPGLVNTSVGSSTYGNFANEACMVIQELDQRGLSDEVERRLRVFLEYAGTAEQPGNFTDFEGSFYGAGGWECGD